MNKCDKSKCITAHLQDDEKEALKMLAKANEIQIPRLPAKAILHWKDLADVSWDTVSDICLSNVLDTQGVCVEANYEEVSKEESMFRMVKDIAKNMLSSSARIAGSSEASFSEKYVMPAIRRVILENTSDNIVYAL